MQSDFVLSGLESEVPAFEASFAVDAATSTSTPTPSPFSVGYRARRRVPGPTSAAVCGVENLARVGVRLVDGAAVLRFEVDAATSPPAKLSREAFNRFARTEPFALERVLTSSDIEPSLITYAAEAVALVVAPTHTLLAALVALLQHPKPYVREGACYGARAHLDRLRDAMQRVARDDENATIREIAQDILEDG